MFWLVVLFLILLGLIFLCDSWLERIVSIVIIVTATCLFKGWDLLDFWLAMLDQFQPIIKIFEGQ